jgi:hypothetical protein
MDESAIRQAILKQYRASLAMLRQAIELCSEDLWESSSFRNRFWHVAYHAVFYTHLYVQVSEAEFCAWAKHVPDSQYLGSRPWAPGEARTVGKLYTKDEVLEYLTVCCAEVEVHVPALRLEDESGFYWLPFNKLELQFYNIRHLQHHTGQLTDRLRAVLDAGVTWVLSK